MIFEGSDYLLMITAMALLWNIFESKRHAALTCGFRVVWGDTIPQKILKSGGSRTQFWAYSDKWDNYPTMRLKIVAHWFVFPYRENDKKLGNFPQNGKKLGNLNFFLNFRSVRMPVYSNIFFSFFPFAIAISVIMMVSSLNDLYGDF